MVNVLLINSPNRTSEPPRHYPYGLAILTSILENEGYDVDTFDGNFQSDEDLIGALKKKNYDFVGISGIITTYLHQKRYAQIIREKSPDSVITSGGGLASAVDAELLKLIPELDIVFIGESEQTLPAFLRVIGGPYDGVAGIAYKDAGGTVINENAPTIQDLDSIPLPNLDAWFIQRYFENKSFPLSSTSSSAQRRGNVLTSRGCPYFCDFCFNSLGRRRVRYRSPDNVLAEIDFLVNQYGVDFISFMDESFLFNRKHVFAIIEGIRKKGLAFNWGVAARSTSVDEVLLSEIADAGCDFIYYGFDSGSPATLERMNKQMTVDDNFEAFRMTVEVGIVPVPNIIIGYDNETLDNIREDYEFLERLIEYGKTLVSQKDKFTFQRGFNNFGAIYFATPYPGSALYKRNINNLPSLEHILSAISGKDAYEITVNVSQIPDEVLVREQKKMESFVRNFTL
ncbi:MAG: radical SAM protein [archaeon]